MHFDVKVRVYNPYYVKDEYIKPISGVNEIGDKYTDFTLDCDSDYFDADELEGAGGFIEVDLNDTYRVIGWSRIEVLNWDEISENLA